ncbi:cupin domain-containing protein [Halomonas stenophila]|uniref:(S)-ureidoglycine aminohydrolase cupin domain-containing protein n=1 Tax=Halomonas stenophila TaxID=795312 RepID=A0A7W5EW36_9GAMM|nr:cupin domain-containing protein [Halomonas stenophila]MBB3232102.1 hypothetical protein [Halomonas stenophila]
MSAVKIIDFQNSTVLTSTSSVEPERRLSGAPEQSLQNMYASAAKDLLSGTWSSEVGKWSVDYSQRHEFCYLIKGHIVLADEDGEESTFKAGDAFVIPVGFKGSWEVIEPVSKYYVIYNVA